MNVSVSLLDPALYSAQQTYWRSPFLFTVSEYTPHLPISEHTVNGMQSVALLPGSTQNAQNFTSGRWNTLVSPPALHSSADRRAWNLYMATSFLLSTRSLRRSGKTIEGGSTLVLPFGQCLYACPRAAYILMST